MEVQIRFLEVELGFTRRSLLAFFVFAVETEVRGACDRGIRSIAARRGHDPSAAGDEPCARLYVGFVDHDEGIVPGARPAVVIDDGDDDGVDPDLGVHMRPGDLLGAVRQCIRRLRAVAPGERGRIGIVTDVAARVAIHEVRGDGYLGADLHWADWAGDVQDDGVAVDDVDRGACCRCIGAVGDLEVGGALVIVVPGVFSYGVGLPGGIPGAVAVEVPAELQRVSVRVVAV